jgi:methyl-accepting chemotaxis protein
MIRFRNISIGKRLFIAFGVLFLFFVASNIVGWMGNDSLSKSFGKIKNDLDLIQAMDDLKLKNTELRLLYMEVIIDKDKGKIGDDIKTWFDRFKKNIAGKKAKDAGHFALEHPEEQKALEKILADIDKMIKMGEERLFPAVLQGGQEPAFWDKMDIDIDNFSEVINGGIDKLIETAKERTNRDEQEEQATVSRIRILIAGIFIASSLAALSVIFLTGRSIVRPVKVLLKRTRELSSGDVDMTVRLEMDRKDEVGELAYWINKFVARIETLIGKVKASSGDIYGSTREIIRGSEDLAGRTNEQATSITETSTTLEQFTAILKQNSENSEEASTMLEIFNQQVQGKKDLIENVTTTMEEINSSSQKIDNIVNVINDISFQTNLLALNAAVEAARAGEAGRGFAVVATEVRNLAQKTAESSKTIQEIVSQNVDSTNKGMELVNETSHFFETIITTVQQMSAKIQDIADGSREQFNGVEQINQSIVQLDKGINQNAALVQEFADTGKKMETGSSELQELVGMFNVGVQQEQPEVQVKTQAKPGEPAAKEENKTADGDFFAATDEEGFEEF